jgi:hypothetical protein
MNSYLSSYLFFLAIVLGNVIFALLFEYIKIKSIFGKTTALQTLARTSKIGLGFLLYFAIGLAFFSDLFTWIIGFKQAVIDLAFWSLFLPLPLYRLRSILRWYDNKNIQRELILDLGKWQKEGLVYLFVGGILIIFAIYNFKTGLLDIDLDFDAAISKISSSIPTIFIAINLIFGYFARLQIQKQGIYCGFVKIPWGQIKAYKWKTKREEKLYILDSGNLLPFSFLELTISLNKKDEVDEILLKYLPDKLVS